MRPLLIATLCSAIPIAATAQSYTAENYLTVVPLSNTTFEVIEDHGEGARGMWCAAASFAQFRLGIPRAERIYVKSPRGPSVSGVGRVGVVFTTQPDGLNPSRSYSVSVRQQGLGLPVHHAYQFCRDYQIEFGDILFRRGGFRP